MVTKLAGTATVFLPFNLGDDGAAGNPVNTAGGATAPPTCGSRCGHARAGWRYWAAT